MIIEFFGLSKTGKSTLMDKINERGYKGINVDQISLLKKLFLFLCC